MNFEVECWCGGEMNVYGEPGEFEADLEMECESCGRGYVLTLTRYREATEN